MSNHRNNIFNKPQTKAYGDERRHDLSKEIMYKTPILPKTIEYSDIDEEMKRWLDKEVDISFEKKKIPTYPLLSNQRFSEYSQTWQHTDESNSLLMNFKTITRDPAPQQGTLNDGSYNIPGDRYWNYAQVSVVEDSGVECYDIYKMRQPKAVDLTYSISIFTNKYELMNIMSNKIQGLFKSIECYIRVNGHYIPLLLENVSDTSEYNLNDRKFFSQTFEVKCMAYILNSDDFKKERVPKRVNVAFHTSWSLSKKPIVTIEDTSNDEFQNIELTINFIKGSKDVAKFRVDEDVYVHNVYATNACNIQIIRNNDQSSVDIRKGFTLRKHEKLVVKIDRQTTSQDAIVKLVGKNPNYLPHSESCIVQNKDEGDNTYIDAYDYPNSECMAEDYLDKGRHTQ